MSSSSPDYIVLGGGSNSLTTACYLSKAGESVMVFERNSQAGGGVVSVETAPGFIGDTHAMGFLTLMANPVIRDDELELQSRFGLEWLYNESPFGSLYSNGGSLISYRSVERTCAEIAKFSERDAKAYADFVDEVRIYLPLLVTGFYAPPMPDAGFKKLLAGSAEGQKLLRFMEMSAMEVLDERFEHPSVKMHFAKWCSEMMISPLVRGAGIAIVLILSMSHDYDLGTVKGGARCLTDALIRCLESHGGELFLNSTVARLVVEDGSCRGIKLDNGEEIRAAKGVVANIHPWRMRDMIPGMAEDLLEKAEAVRLSDYGVFNQQYALSEVPEWKAGKKCNGGNNTRNS